MEHKTIPQVPFHRTNNISKDSARALVQILRHRGFFHDNKTPQSTVVDRENDQPLPSSTRFLDIDCSLVPTTNDAFVTFSTLCNMFEQEVNRSGRCTVSEGARKLHVPQQILRKAIESVVACHSSTLVQVAPNGDEVVTQDYIDEKMSELQGSLSEPMPITEVANLWRIPYEQTFQLIQKKLPVGLEIRMLESGARVLVLKEHMKSYRRKVLSVISTSIEPITLTSACREHGWQHSWVLEMLMQNIQDIPGELHGDTFIPKVYIQQQQQLVKDAFAIKGFVTASNAALSMAQIVECVRSVYPSALVLSSSIIHPDVIVGPLEEAIQETNAAGGWLELELHLPLELVQAGNDFETIVYEHVLANNPSGVAVIAAQHGLYVSQLLLDRIRQDTLPLLIEQHATHHATVSMDPTQPSGTTGNSDHLLEPRKRKLKKKAIGTQSQPIEAQGFSPSHDSMAPQAIQIARAIGEAHPDLKVFMGDGETDTSLLVLLCLKAFPTDELERQCQDAINVERKRLLKSRMVATTQIAANPASQLRNIEQAFESPLCFTNACFMIQTMYNFVIYANDSGMDQSNLDIIRSEFLNGCCADLTSRITQFCLFQNGVSAELFEFDVYFPSTETGSQYNTVSADSYSYYAPVDIAQRRYPRFYLSCRDTNVQPMKLKEPLPLLREVLPGTIGVSLASLWIHCGGECYQGGVRKGTHDGLSVHLVSRSADVDAFLSHVTENCLLVCGLPFKRLDKKAEKKLLFDRREHLLRKLSVELDAAGVLELVIMILYQQVKNMVVTGSLLRGPILDMLVKERKVTTEISTELKVLAQSLTETDPNDIDQELVERVRAIGLGGCTRTPRR